VNLKHRHDRGVQEISLRLPSVQNVNRVPPAGDAENRRKVLRGVKQRVSLFSLEYVGVLYWAIYTVGKQLRVLVNVTSSALKQSNRASKQSMDLGNENAPKYSLNFSASRVALEISSFSSGLKRAMSFTKPKRISVCSVRSCASSTIITA
jgi:hypothetical protein